MGSETAHLSSETVHLNSTVSAARLHRMTSDTAHLRKEMERLHRETAHLHRMTSDTAHLGNTVSNIAHLHNHALTRDSHNTNRSLPLIKHSLPLHPLNRQSTPTRNTGSALPIAERAYSISRESQ